MFYLLYFEFNLNKMHYPVLTFIEFVSINYENNNKWNSSV